MSITARTLYRDSFHFFRHQIVTLVLIALLTAFISMVINQIMTPNANEFDILSSNHSQFSGGAGLQEIIQQMTPEQQLVLLKVSAAASLSALVGNVLLLSGILSLIPLVSQGHRLSALRTLGIATPLLPRLFLLMFLCTLMVQLGITFFIVPGIILTVGLALSPIIMVNDKVGVFSAIRLSFRLSFANVRLISPAVLSWLAAKLLLLLLVSRLSSLPPNLGLILMGTISNLISALLIIYLFRLYMLLK